MPVTGAINVAKVTENPRLAEEKGRKMTTFLPPDTNLPSRVNWSNWTNYT
jgi:hypothetical protein